MSTGANHAGDLSPAEAMESLKEEPDSILIDVRTSAEWDKVGVPDISGIGRSPVFIEWVTAPTMSPNPAFFDQMTAELADRGADKDARILFLCRSGSRSAAAARAMTERGFTRAFNVTGGFEGSPSQGLPGWRQSGLPWSIG